MKDDARHPSSFIVHPPSFLIAALIFLASRIVLLYLRQPFFDELFTVWMARQPLAAVLPHLLRDSGPPLYYWIARFDSVEALRLLSLLFASLQFALLTRRSVMAAALFALYPPAVLFAVDARAYALCSLLVTLGVILLDLEKPWPAAAAFAAAAYSHYYGVLFFPLLLVARPRRTGVVALAAACGAFVPGFILALHQPAQATAWNREPLWAPLLNLSFAGAYPEALFKPVPVVVAAAATVVLAIALHRSWRFAPAVLVPLIIVSALHVAGRAVYFPMRFESVIAGPLVLWIADSLERMRPRIRWAVAGVLLIAGAAVVWRGIMFHMEAGPDPYREAALVLRSHARADEPVVATGYLYLEATVALDRPVRAWPAEQALHPGWRTDAPADPAALPAGAFLWTGERQAEELRTLLRARPVRPLFWNGRAVIARVGALTPR